MSANVELTNETVGFEVENTQDGAVEQNQLGVRVVDSEYAASGAGSLAPVTTLPDARLGSFIQRRTWIRTSAIAVTDVAFTSLGAFDPWGLFIDDPVIAAKLRDFRYIRATLELEISLNVPAGTYGRYYVVCDPVSGVQGGALGTSGFSVEIAECVPHIAIDVATCTKGVIRLPWIQWVDYGDLTHATPNPDGVRGMWNVHLVCYQPLGQGNGSTVPTGTVAYYARCLDDVELVVPFQKQMKRGKGGALPGKDLKASQVVGGISTWMDKAAHVPVIGMFAKPVAAGAAAASRLLDYFGFTRQTDQRVPMPIVPRPFANVANADGGDTSEIAALSVANELSIDPRISATTTLDEGAFDYLFQRYVCVGAVPWTMADAAGDVLKMFPVTPFLARSGMETGSVFPMAGYIGFPFSYWRGDIDVKIVVPLSKLHRGILQFAWGPVDAAANDVTNNQFNVIHDMVAGSELEFTVGYQSFEPMLEVEPHIFDAPVGSTAGANGMFRISVVSPLEGQAETSDTNVFVFVRARAGTRFAVPRSIGVALDDDGARTEVNFASSFIVQSGALGDEDGSREQLVLVPAAPKFPIREVCAGEEVESVRMLMQKFTQDPNFGRAFELHGNRSIVVNHLPQYPRVNQDNAYAPAPPSAAPVPTAFNWAGWYSVLFVGVASSTRYKVVQCGPDPLAVAISHFDAATGHDRTAFLGSTSLSSVAPVWTAGVGDGVEVTVPFYNDRKWLFTCAPTPAAKILDGTLPGRIDEIRVLPVAGQTDVYPQVCVYTAFGPDIRLHVARFPRRIKYLEGGSTVPIYGNLAYIPPG